MSSGWVDGVQSRKTVRGGGSSIALSSALPAASVSRSASSMITTCQRRRDGVLAARSTSARISPTPIESPSGTTSRTSAWVPPSVVWQAGQSPQPVPRAHCSAAANARAATDRPEPGGPVKIQAWVIPPRLAGRGVPGGEQPPRGLRRPAQDLHRVVLADEIGEDLGHQGRRSGSPFAAPISSASDSSGSTLTSGCRAGSGRTTLAGSRTIGSMRARIASKVSSAGRAASSTR